MSESTQELLTHHWALDEMAAEAFTSKINSAEDERIHEVGERFDPVAVSIRDAHRQDIAASYTRQSDQMVFVEGPCSPDADTDYDELFDVIEWLQDEHPQVKMGVRITGKKPRTKGGWRGLAYSTDPKDRQRYHEILTEGLTRGRAIFFEVTDGQELGEYAPYSSSFWLGARDMASTALRAAAAGIHLPWAGKNGLDGSAETLENTLLSARMNSRDSEDSGFNLGTIAADAFHRGIPTGILPIGHGNPYGAIIARGFPIPKDTPAEKGRLLALEHVSQMCRLGRKLGRTVLIDKTHGAPAMLGIKKDDENYSERLVTVSKVITEAIVNGEIDDDEYIGGEVAEIGTTKGRTDPNFIISWQNKSVVSDLIGRAIEASQN